MSSLTRLNEKITKIINEELSDQFMLTDLEYTINYASGKPYTDSIKKVDTLRYTLYDLGAAQLADIVVANLQNNGFIYTTEDSSNVDYDPETGIIKSVDPIVVSVDSGEDKAYIEFKVTLWTHPERIDYR